MRNAQRTTSTQHYFTPKDFFPELGGEPDETEPVALSSEDLLKKMDFLFPVN